MADKRISELTALAGASVADDDALAIVDTSATQTKKIVFSELKSALDTSTGFVRITGDTMTGDLTVPNLVTAGNVDGRDLSVDGVKLDSIEASADVTDTANVTAAGALMDSELADVSAVKGINQALTTTSAPTFNGMTTTGDITFGDNVKAKFGNSDLEIYHNGSDSYVDDSGSGGLILRGNAAVTIGKYTGETMGYFEADGSAYLYHNNAIKFQTSSSGISISGGATLDNDGTLLDFSRVGDAVAGQLKYVDADTGFHFGTTTNHDWYGISNDTKRLKIDNAGDISFYDTSGNAGLLWDASAASLGVGTTSPSSLIHAVGGAGTNIAIQSTAGSHWRLGDAVGASNGTFVLYDYTNSAVRLAVNGSGNVGISTSNPAANLDVVGVIRLTNTANSANYGTISDGGGLVINSQNNNPMYFYTGGSERMRIDSSGNLLVGASQTASSGLGVITGKNITFTEGNTTTSYVNIFRQSSSAAGILANGYRYSETSEKMQSSLSSSWAKSAVGVYSGYIGFFTDAASADTIGTDLTPTERMRIDSSGNLLVGHSSFGFGGANDCVQIAGSEGRINIENDTTSTQYVAAFYNPNGLVGKISTNSSSTSYATSSDYRLKENVVDVTDGITRVKQLAPKRFNFIADADTTVDGFLAHEAQAVVPEAVTGEKDEVDADGNAVMQGIDQAKLVPLLTAALQEAIAKIETLETKVAALEGA